MYNRILEETGKQFLKKFIQSAAVELSTNIIIEGIKTGFELYKQRKFMEMNVEYADVMQQQQMQEGHDEEEDPEPEEIQQPPKPKPKSRPKSKPKAK